VRTLNSGVRHTHYATGEAMVEWSGTRIASAVVGTEDCIGEEPVNIFLKH
jgi:hypothetical protein